MKKYLVIAIALLPISTMAADFSLTPRVMVGVMNFKWEPKSVEFTRRGRMDNPLSDNILFMGIGGTLVFDRFFIDGYFQETGEGEDSGSFTGTPDENLTVKVPSAFQNFDRQDYFVSLGYAITDKLSAFVGYKGSEQSVDLPTSFGLKDEHNNDLVGFDSLSSNFDYEAKGPFVGVAYGWRLAEGVLSFNFAYAYLEATYNSKYTLRMEGGSTQYFEFDAINHDATGTTLGMKWRAPITNNLSYSATLSGYQYNCDVVKETIISLQAGLMYNF
jgi:hypothetical protein